MIQVVEYIHLNEARKVLRLSCEEVLDLLEKGELQGRPPRLLSASAGYDYCTGWLVERRSFEKYLARNGRSRRKATKPQPEVHAGLLTGNKSDSPVLTGF